MSAALLAGRYRTGVIDRRATTVSAVLAAFAGTLTLGEFPAVAAAVTAAGMAHQVTFAEQYLALVLTVESRRLIPAVGLLPSTYIDPARLAAAYTSALDLYADPVPSLMRITGAETTDTGRAALSDGMAARDVGWTRHTGGTPCPLCASLDDGSILPPSVPMTTHPGCGCVAEIVTRSSDTKRISVGARNGSRSSPEP